MENTTNSIQAELLPTTTTTTTTTASARTLMTSRLSQASLDLNQIFENSPIFFLSPEVFALALFDFYNIIRRDIHSKIAGLTSGGDLPSAAVKHLYLQFLANESRLCEQIMVVSVQLANTLQSMDKSILATPKRTVTHSFDTFSFSDFLDPEIYSLDVFGKHMNDSGLDDGTGIDARQFNSSSHSYEKSLNIRLDDKIVGEIQATSAILQTLQEDLFKIVTNLHKKESSVFDTFFIKEEKLRVLFENENLALKLNLQDNQHPTVRSYCSQFIYIIIKILRRLLLVNFNTAVQLQKYFFFQDLRTKIHQAVHSKQKTIQIGHGERQIDAEEAKRLLMGESAAFLTTDEGVWDFINKRLVCHHIYWVNRQNMNEELQPESLASFGSLAPFFFWKAISDAYFPATFEQALVPPHTADIFNKLTGVDQVAVYTKSIFKLSPVRLATSVLKMQNSYAHIWPPEIFVNGTSDVIPFSYIADTDADSDCLMGPNLSSVFREICGNGQGSLIEFYSKIQETIIGLNPSTGETTLVKFRILSTLCNLLKVLSSDTFKILTMAQNPFMCTVEFLNNTMLTVSPNVPQHHHNGSVDGPQLIDFNQHQQQSAVQFVDAAFVGQNFSQPLQNQQFALNGIDGSNQATLLSTYPLYEPVNDKDKDTFRYVHESESLRQRWTSMKMAINFLNLHQKMKKLPPFVICHKLEDGVARGVEGIGKSGTEAAAAAFSPSVATRQENLQQENTVVVPPGAINTVVNTTQKELDTVLPHDGSKGHVVKRKKGVLKADNQTPNGLKKEDERKKEGVIESDEDSEDEHLPIALRRRKKRVTFATPVIENTPNTKKRKRDSTNENEEKNGETVNKTDNEEGTSSQKKRAKPNPSAVPSSTKPKAKKAGATPTD